MADAGVRAEREMSPAEWLAAIRKKYGLVGNLAVSDDWLEDFLGRLPESERKAAREIWVARRSTLASEVHDKMMEEYLKQVLPVLRQDEKRLATTTFFGVLPTYQFNAYAGKTPRGDQIVILHHELAYTLSYWSHWYLRMKDERGRAYLNEDPEKLFEALAYIVAVWHGQRPNSKLPDIYPNTYDSWQLDQCLVFSAIAFVIGHELGHILAGHDGYGPHQVQNHEMEFEADRRGVSVAVRHSLVKSALIRGDTYHAKFMLFGPLFALAVVSLLSDHDSHTHPSASQRRIRMLAAYEHELRSSLGDKFDDFLDDVDRDVIAVLERNSELLFNLYSGYRDVILELRSVIPTSDTPWLRAEFADFWS
jgi:hypothetical protein